MPWGQYHGGNSSYQVSSSSDSSLCDVDNQDTSTGVPQWDFSYGQFSDEEWESPGVPKKGQNERTSKELFLTKLSLNTWTVLDKELFSMSVGPSLSAEVREPPPPIWEWGEVVREQRHNSAWSFLAKLDSLKKICFYLKFRHVWFLYL